MRTKIATLVLCLVLSLTIMAQRKTDAFFNYQDDRADRCLIILADEEGLGLKNMEIVEHAPLGNGLLKLLVVSVFYSILKNREDVK